MSAKIRGKGILHVGKNVNLESYHKQYRFPYNVKRGTATIVSLHMTRKPFRHINLHVRRDILKALTVTIISIPKMPTDLETDKGNMVDIQ